MYVNNNIFSVRLSFLLLHNVNLPGSAIESMQHGSWAFDCGNPKPCFEVFDLPVFIVRSSMYYPKLHLVHGTIFRKVKLYKLQSILISQMTICGPT